MQLVIFLLLSVTSIVLIFYFTVNERTYETLLNYNPLYLLFCLFLWFLALTIDALGVIFFVLGTGEKIRFYNCYKLSTIRVFFNLLTPFTFGGQPLIIYFLNKYGVPSGKGSTIVITRLMCTAFFTMGGGIIALFLFKDTIGNNIMLSNVFLVTGILLALLFGVLILIMLFPPIMKTLIGFTGNIGYRLRIIKNLSDFNEKAIREINNMRSSFINYFRKHFGFFLSGFICTGLFFFIHIFIILAIIYGFGIPIDTSVGIILCLILFFCISYMPTPGSSGLGEGIFFLIFNGFVPYYLIGIVVILWRTFYQYLSALAGAVFSAKFFSKVIVKRKTK